MCFVLKHSAFAVNRYLFEKVFNLRERAVHMTICFWSCDRHMFECIISSYPTGYFQMLKHDLACLHYISSRNRQNTGWVLSKKHFQLISPPSICGSVYSKSDSVQLTCFRQTLIARCLLSACFHRWLEPCGHVRL